MFRRVITPACALAFLVSGCQRYVFEFQPESKVIGKSVDLTVDRPSEADILFVIDSSGSMATHQANLRNNIKVFIETLALSPQKFQIGITTTDLNCANLIPATGTADFWDGKCGRLLSPDGADPIMRRVDYADNNALIDRFQKTVESVGIAGSGYEQGLKAAARAVSADLTAPGKSNANFVRPTALLGIVFMSDEWDCSYSDDPQLGDSIFLQTRLSAAQSCYEFEPKLETVKHWADAVTQVKGRASLVSASSITAGTVADKVFTPSQCSVGGDGLPTTACSCFQAQPTAFCKYTDPSSPPAGSVVLSGPQESICFGDGCCQAMGNPRYASFVDFFRLRFKDSICRTEYKQTLVEIAKILQRDCFPLEDGPAGGREDWIRVQRRGVGETAFVDVPQVPASVGFDGDGWFLFKDSLTTTGATVSEVCLTGSFKRVIGDAYKIDYTSEVAGLDSDIPAGDTPNQSTTETGR